MLRNPGSPSRKRGASTVGFLVKLDFESLRGRRKRTLIIVFYGKPNTRKETSLLISTQFHSWVKTNPAQKVSSGVLRKDAPRSPGAGTPVTGERLADEKGWISRGGVSISSTSLRQAARRIPSVSAPAVDADVG